MILSRTKDRIVQYWKENDGSIIIQEKEAFTPTGYSKRRWTDNRVALSKQEIESMIADMEKVSHIK